MKRPRSMFIFLSTFLLFVLAISVGVVYAVDNHQPSTPSCCSFTVKSSVPFVWVRAAPSSTAAPKVTLFRGTIVMADTVRAQSGVVWDGVQWWVKVRCNLFFVVVDGWIELASLDHMPGPLWGSKTSPAAWKAGTPVHVRAQAPFVWFRNYPLSYAVPIYTVYSGAALLVRDYPISDGQQWWWPVQERSGVWGWVEQKSLEFSVPITATPIPPTASNIGSPANWPSGTALRIRFGIPFVWLRAYPQSDAATIYTFYSTGPNAPVLVVVGAPAADARQWWWPMKDFRSGLWGWIEQNSLEVLPANTATPVPTSTATPSEGNTYTVVQTQAAYQPFENGFMIWLANNGSNATIDVLLAGGQVKHYDQSTLDRLPDNPVTDQPPAGRVKPIRGFGRIWGNFPEVRSALGWALQDEAGYTATVLYPRWSAIIHFLKLPNGHEVRFTLGPNGLTWSYEN